MCELCLPRRRVLLGAAGTVLAGGIGRRSSAAAAVPEAPWQAPAPVVVARAEWGGDLPPLGPIPDEPDVRFLLVHHTVNTNDYAPGDVVGLLAGIYRFHTGPERGWPDVAYNFFVDRFGTIYEGRTGSLAGPKAADATGGSQGFAQLCAFLGDHREEPPSDLAIGSMAAMLAFLGDRHALDLSPGTTATFVSRGSNLHPAGEEVTTPTISGHRDMSVTTCPGEAAYALLADGTFARLATAARQPPVSTTTTVATVATSTTTPPPTTAATTSSAPSPPTTAERTDDDGGPRAPLAIVAATAVAATAAIIALRRRTGV
jgi:hypothetical protein